MKFLLGVTKVSLQGDKWFCLLLFQVDINHQTMFLNAILRKKEKIVNAQKKSDDELSGMLYRDLFMRNHCVFSKEREKGKNFLH